MCARHAICTNETCCSQGTLGTRGTQCQQPADFVFVQLQVENLVLVRPDLTPRLNRRDVHAHVGLRLRLPTGRAAGGAPARSTLAADLSGTPIQRDERWWADRTVEHSAQISACWKMVRKVEARCSIRSHTRTLPGVMPATIRPASASFCEMRIA